MDSLGAQSQSLNQSVNQSFIKFNYMLLHIYMKYKIIKTRDYMLLEVYYHHRY